MSENDTVIIKVFLSNDIKEEFEKIARDEGYSASTILRKLVLDYIHGHYYKKLQSLINIEDRIQTALLLEINPIFENINANFKNIRIKIDVLWELMKKKYGEEKLKDIEKNVEKNMEESLTIYRRESSAESGDFPHIPGLGYKIKNDDVIYEDGSIYNTTLGIWILTKDKVREWKSKNLQDI